MGGKENMDTIWPLHGLENKKEPVKKFSREEWNKIKENQLKLDQQIIKERKNG